MHHIFDDKCDAFFKLKNSKNRTYVKNALKEIDILSKCVSKMHHIWQKKKSHS